MFDVACAIVDFDGEYVQRILINHAESNEREKGVYTSAV